MTAFFFHVLKSFTVFHSSSIMQKLVAVCKPTENINEGEGAFILFSYLGNGGDGVR